MGKRQGIGGSTQLALADSLPADAASAFASAKLRALGWALAAIVALCLLVMLGSLAATHRESTAIATEREQQQVRNALATSIGDMRSDLTSITFWDEAAERTGVRFDPKWADENVGVWLARYYSVDESFVLSDAGTPLAAYRGASPAALSDFKRYRPFVLPMLQRVRGQLRAYRPGRPGQAYGVVDVGPRRLDVAQVVTVDGFPHVLVVAPILPDFGHIGGPLEHPAMLVASYRFDGKLLRTIGGDLMIGGLHVSPRRKLGADGLNHLPIAVAGSGAPLELR
jgi:sensor domain CHASE-containing protein